MINQGFFRVAAVSPKVSVADCKANADVIIDIVAQLAKEGVQLAVFPELCVTSYTCADLFHNSYILDDAWAQLQRIALDTADFDMAFVVGAPLRVNNALYNCAFVIRKGRIVSVVPKSYLPNYNEFYEKRWWQAGPQDITNILTPTGSAPFGTRQLIDVDGVNIGVEICEDLWTPVPPSCHAAMAGADIIVNLSASDDLIGKYAYLNSLISQQSARCICGYVYASAGYGESSTDLVFDGKTLIAENGSVLARNKRWQSGSQFVVADIDVEAIRRDRLHLGSFDDCRLRENKNEYSIFPSAESPSAPRQDSTLLRKVNPTPFVPSDSSERSDRCDEIINIQVAGLAKRLEFIHCKTVVIGVSGGLDSTLALLVAAKTFDRLNIDRKGIIGITMPGFGTTNRTKNNAWALMEQLGITPLEIPIGEAVDIHFRDINHNPDVHDVTYENSQARERTQILMDVANQKNAIVIGTGDMSELALGWATYNGDHMSMYGVNAGVPKTLVKYLVSHFANDEALANCHDTLLDIVDTPISPELIPADSKGNITQKTEDLVGPYILHDFFLYYTLRFGFSPKRIFFLAKVAFDGQFDAEVIEKWLKVFVRRFFSQQFKRSCMPDGPKVGSVCLSPRGDWRMPSDAVAFKF